MENDFSGELIQTTDAGKVVVKFLNGQKDGITRFISSDGVILSEVQYKKDMICGNVKQYYQNGKILSIVEYKYGVPHGTLTSFFENGMKQVVAQYQNGKIDGVFKAFDEFGDIVNECAYYDGQKHGKNLLYYPKFQGGGVYESSNYKDGCLDGDKITFYQTGEIMSVIPYKNGKAQAYPKYYKKTGEEKD